MSTEDEEWQSLLTDIVPAYNEEDAIGPTLRGLRERLPRAEIVVVDDHSTDRTHDEACTVPGVRIIRHAYNCGYGGALKTGMVVADREYVAWFDAYGEHLLEDLVAIVDKLHR